MASCWRKVLAEGVAGTCCGTVLRDRVANLHYRRGLLIYKMADSISLGVWRSGSASALHAEGLGFDPLVVHTFCFFASRMGFFLRFFVTVMQDLA